jgi:hypothetical protein
MASPFPKGRVMLQPTPVVSELRVRMYRGVINDTLRTQDAGRANCSEAEWGN